MCGAGDPVTAKSLSQPFLYFHHRKPRHSNHLPAATLAGRYGNGRTRNLQKICKEIDAGFVGPAIDGRRGQRQFDCIANFASDCVLFCSRMNLHGEGHAGGCFMNRDQSKLEVTTIGRSARAVIDAGSRQHANNSSQTFPRCLVQCRVRANEVTNHIPRRNIESAFRRRSHRQRNRALRTKAYSLGRRFLPRPHSYSLREHIDGHRFVSRLQLPITTKAV